MGLLDILFPKYCVACKKLGSYICANCFAKLSFDTQSLCVVCNKPSIYGFIHPQCRGRHTIDGIFSSITYNKTAKKLLYVFKYKPYVFKLDKLLGKLFYEGIIQHEGFAKALQYHPTIVAIPLHSSKLRKRGYNHAKLLANYLGSQLLLPQKTLLLRTKNTFSQYGLNRKKRIENIHGAFTLNCLQQNAKMNLPNAVLLVDDIVTTGSTFLEAARVLKKNGVNKVWGLALARG